MENIDWKDLAGEITSLMRLSKPPVAMKWVKSEEELQAIPKVRTHDKHLPPCTIVEHAMQFNWTSACKFENIHADYCRAIHGLVAKDERFYSGEMFMGAWFDDVEQAAKHHGQLETANPEYYAIVASPLVSGRIENPDVVVLDVIPAQAFLIMAGYQYENYERIQLTFSGESTCSDSWIHTFNTGKPGMALPCYADKKFAGMGESEVRVTFTAEDFVRTVKGLKALYKNGLRYPIASYSLTQDIIAGLPPHYLKF